MDKRLKSFLLIGLALAALLAGSAFTLQKKVSKDKAPPTVVLAIPAPTGNNGWYNQPVQILVKAWDGGSGISNVQISLGGGTWYKRSLTIRKDGTYYVIGRATDKAGNMASVTEIVRVDLTPPTVDFVVPQEDGQQDWYIGPIALDLRGSDELSGVFKTSLSAKGNFEGSARGLLDSRENYVEGQTQDSGQILVAGSELSASSAYIRITQSGDYTVSGYVEDMAGNRTPVETSLSIDLEKPQVSYTSPDTYYGDITMSGQVTESGSGVAGVWLNSGSGWKRASVSGLDWSYVWPTDGLKDGDYTIKTRVIDKAGNSSESSAKITVLNHFWPVAAIFGILISLGLAALYDPRRSALMELTKVTAKYAHMDKSARLLERKKYD